MGVWRKKSDGSGILGTPPAAPTTPEEMTPLIPHMTSVNYGPLVSQAIKKRFGRNQTILGAGLGNKTLLGG